MLDEGVQIMRQLWTDGKATLDGEHYQVDGAIGRPLPLQDGGIPLWIAGGGEKKTLRIAAQYAQYTNFDATPETFGRKSEILEQHCRDVGRDFGEITRSSNFNVVIAATEKDVQDRIAWLQDHFRKVGVPDKLVESRVEDFRRSPGTGTPEQIVERLQALEKLGAKYLITYFYEAAYDTTGIAMFERDVIPELVDKEQHGHLWHLGR